MLPDLHYLISCDWGTSSFRLRLLQGREAPRVLADQSSSRGILSFPPGEPDEFRSYLMLELDRLFRSVKRSPEPIPIYLSGMITSTLGWRDVPYSELPYPLDGSQSLQEPTILERVYGSHDMVFISGLRSPDDVMRGEETELIGIFQDPHMSSYSKSCVVVLPGTHSKVVEIEQNQVVAFRTYMTGELFDLLRQHSILRHSVLSPHLTALSPKSAPEVEMFEAGIRKGAREGLLDSLFTVRTNDLLRGIPLDSNGYYLSGLLIGNEVHSILARFPPPVPILVCGTPQLQSLYCRAFQTLGESSRLHAVADEMTALAASLGHWSLHLLRSHQTEKQECE